MDYAHLNLEHFLHEMMIWISLEIDLIFVMINNFTNEMKYREGEIEGTIDLNQYYYKNRSQAVSFIMMNYKK